MPRSKSSNSSSSRSRSRSSHNDRDRRRRRRYSSSSSSRSSSSSSRSNHRHRNRRNDKSHSRDKYRRRNSRSNSQRKDYSDNRRNFYQRNNHQGSHTFGQDSDRNRPYQAQSSFYQKRNDNYINPQQNGGEYEPFQKVFIREDDPFLKRDKDEIKEFRKKNEIIIRSTHTHVPSPFFSFDECSLFPKTVIDEIIKAGFKKPTPIQSQAFSIALSGHDMIGIAQTGSGKTLAFLLPAIVHIMAQRPLDTQDGPIALVLSPTRELTLQINEQFQKFASKTRLNAACLYGGQEKSLQRAQLRDGVHIVIACPGRLIDFVESYYTTLNRVTYVVLDEADRMLDMGFEPQIRKILGMIRPDKQILLFSATWPKEVQQLALDFCQSNPVHIQIGDLDLTANKKIKQKIHVINSYEKNKRLLQVLREMPRDSKGIIFCATKKGCEGLSRQIQREGFRCISLHGDKSQKDRDYAMDNFRDSKVRLLFATDVASRGLDVKDISFVINYDMPKAISDYVHRIGRTGRAGAHGLAITFFAQDEDVRLAKDLIGVLKQGDQEIPKELYSLGARSKPQSNNQFKKARTQEKDKKKEENSWNDPAYLQKYQQYLPYLTGYGPIPTDQFQGNFFPAQPQYFQPHYQMQFSNPALASGLVQDKSTIQ